MSPVVIGIVVLGGFAVFLFANPSFAFAASGDGGDSSGDSPSGETSADAPPPSGVHPEFDPLIAQAAKDAGVDPVLLKAICATESGFNPDSINPEKDFILNGVSYGQNDRAGRLLLVQWIKAGNDPASIGLNPSCGLAQVRVGNAKKFISGLDAWDLFDPATGLEAGAYALADMGATLDTADMYNVGHGTNLARGVRNAPYQARVAMFYSQFQGDF
jgi:soluble lytic murein transglycosylase-like protein